MTGKVVVKERWLRAKMVGKGWRLKRKVVAVDGSSCGVGSDAALKRLYSLMILA